jgi:xylulokinase
MKKNEYLLGLDIGSSSIKAALLNVKDGKVRAVSSSPCPSVAGEGELGISVPRPGFAEQDPETWWDHVKRAVARLRQTARADTLPVRAIGISYQMHGLVVVDDAGRPLRPSIIWCDSRAVAIGNRAFSEIGKTRALGCLLNSPGNFTASKLRWIKENEPRIFNRIRKMMLPGDYIAFRLTGRIATTPSGLSEGILWDFQKGAIADIVLNQYGIGREVIPDVVPTFSIQGRVSDTIARELGITPGAVVSYRAGDQPNNAFAVKVLDPGEIAATAGTSGVVYGVGGRPFIDEDCRVNTFIHVNHTPKEPRYGVLLCVNGTGILNRWLKENMACGGRYDRMNEAAASVPVGALGLVILPYGNGAERSLDNRNPGASLHYLDLNVHARPHVLRAAQEGIVYALNYGIDIMRTMGMSVDVVRAGYANMFLSPLFCEAFSTTAGVTLELFETDGAQGAARGAGVGAGVYGDFDEVFSHLVRRTVIEPTGSLSGAYRAAYERWRTVLSHAMCMAESAGINET